MDEIKVEDVKIKNGYQPVNKEKARYLALHGDGLWPSLRLLPESEFDELVKQSGKPIRSGNIYTVVKSKSGDYCLKFEGVPPEVENAREKRRVSCVNCQNSKICMFYETIKGQQLATGILNNFDEMLGIIAEHCNYWILKVHD